MRFFPIGHYALRSNDDFAGHFWVHATEVGVFAWVGEAEFEFVVGIEGCGFEFALRAIDGVRDVVLVAAV